jgi:hypothetical protein
MNGGRHRYGGHNERPSEVSASRQGRGRPARYSMLERKLVVRILGLPCIRVIQVARPGTPSATTVSKPSVLMIVWSYMFINFLYMITNIAV